MTSSHQNAMDQQSQVGYLIMMSLASILTFHIVLARAPGTSAMQMGNVLLAEWDLDPKLWHAHPSLASHAVGPRMALQPPAGQPTQATSTTRASLHLPCRSTHTCRCSPYPYCRAADTIKPLALRSENRFACCGDVGFSAELGARASRNSESPNQLYPDCLAPARPHVVQAAAPGPLRSRAVQASANEAGNTSHPQ